MAKRTFKSTVKRIFKWVACQKYQHRRKLSDYRATNLAIRLTVTGALTPCRAISSYERTAAK